MKENNFSTACYEINIFYEKLIKTNSKFETFRLISRIDSLIHFFFRIESYIKQQACASYVFVRDEDTRDGRRLSVLSSVI
ncbi:hypothetical protein PGB90_003774 [Kerria lacca]